MHQMKKMLQTLASLGTSETVSEHVARDLESFICRVYRSDTKIKTLAALRWWMFTTKQTLGDKMPPSTGAFLPALNRVNFQAMVWEMDKQSRPNIPSPVGHGWIIEDGLLTPVMCDLPCSPRIHNEIGAMFLPRKQMQCFLQMSCKWAPMHRDV